MTDDKLLLSSREASRLLSVSPRTLWQWRKTGCIPYVRVGRVVRFSRAALEDWIARQSRPNDKHHEHMSQRPTEEGQARGGE